MPTSGKISIYIHVPFCVKKCPYCHFYSVYPHKELKTKYLKALHKEIKSLPLKNREISSLYFGGGTPSNLEANEIAEIISLFPSINKNTEITLETNPDNVNSDTIKGFKGAGINRISMGVQSFNNEELKLLGRSHDAKKALNSIETILKLGIQKLSIDLIYDLPGQTLDLFQNSLNIALKSEITHLSLYNLTFEPGTDFYKNHEKYQNSLPSSELSLNMLNTATEVLDSNEFKRYEISAFGKNGERSVHNTGYWTGREFFGLGPSAFSYVNKKRYQNVANINNYINLIDQGKSAVDFEEKLEKTDHLKELLAINLRMIEGVNIRSFEENHGYLPNDLKKQIESLIDNDFLEKVSSNIRLTKKGLLFYDFVASEII